MKVKIDFCDFGPGFVKTNNFFYNILKPHFDLELSACPDFVIFGDLGQHVHRVHNCVKIFSCVEDFWPDFRHYDYCFTCHQTEDRRNLRLPYYVHFGQAQTLQKDRNNAEKLLAEKSKFCSFLVSYANDKTRVRNEFFHKLCKYKKVDSAGGALNNVGYRVPPGPAAKQAFLRPYKFHIAFENAAVPEYTTEKIVEAMQARSLPIYWGNPRIAEEFNPRGFLNYVDFPSEDALIDKIIELDQDDAKYLEYVREPYFHNNKPNEFFSTERLVEHFKMIFSTPITPVSAKPYPLRISRWIVVLKNRPNRLPPC